MTPALHARLLLLPVKQSLQRRYPWTAVLGLLAAAGTTAGFALGGVGLLAESIQQARKPKTVALPPHLQQKQRYTPAVLAAYEQSFSAVLGPDYRQRLAATGLLLRFAADFWETLSPNEGEGVRTLRPTTMLGQFGLNFGRFGVGLSAVAGIFNGIALRLPLMSIGDSLNLFAAPIIHMPLGLGLFHMGLASIFSSRAIEQDETSRLNPAVWARKNSLGEKLAYIGQNVKHSLGAMWHSTAVTVKHMAGLLSSQHRQGAKDFFRHEFFSFKPKFALLAEMLDSQGRSFVVPAIKSSPYFMHVASLLLGLGGLVLTVGNVLGNKRIEKIGYRGCTTGGSLDNISLFKQGFEKVAFGAPAAGITQSLAGLTVFSGQNTMDTLWGRGLMWLGIGLLFATFAIERRTELVRALADRQSPLRQAANQMIRRWELNPLKALGPNPSAELTLFNKAILAFHAGPDAFAQSLQRLKAVNPKLCHALESVFESLNGRAYQLPDSEVWAKLQQRMPAGVSITLNKPGKPYQALLDDVKADMARQFGISVA